MLVNILYVVDVTFFSTRFFASVGNWHISEICQKMANLACFKSASNLHFSFLQFWALVILKWHSFSWSLTFQKGCHPVFYRGHTHKKKYHTTSETPRMTARATLRCERARSEGRQQQQQQRQQRKTRLRAPSSKVSLHPVAGESVYQSPVWVWRETHPLFSINLPIRSGLKSTVLFFQCWELKNFFKSVVLHWKVRRLVKMIISYS